MIRYESLQDVQRRHDHGFAVKHCPLALLEPGVGDWYSWHRNRGAAWRELKSGGIAGDERVIPIMRTDLYMAERERILSLRRERRRIRESGRRQAAGSSSPAAS